MREHFYVSSLILFARDIIGNHLWNACLHFSQLTIEDLILYCDKCFFVFFNLPLHLRNCEAFEVEAIGRPRFNINDMHGGEEKKPSCLLLSHIKPEK